MIQILLITIVAVWLAWGIANVVWGFCQIFWGIACGIAAILLYTLAATLELIFAIFPNRKGSI